MFQNKYFKFVTSVSLVVMASIFTGYLIANGANYLSATFLNIDNGGAYISGFLGVGIANSGPNRLRVSGDVLIDGTNLNMNGVYTPNYTAGMTGTLSSYQFAISRYVIDAPPSSVGRVVPLDVSTVNSLCRDFDGCQITIALINWEAATRPDNVASRWSKFFISTSDWWRADWYGSDPQSRDNNSAVGEFNAWDCYFTDAETSTNNTNGRNDQLQGFGFLNASGGGQSDTTTTCRLIIED